MDIKMHKLFKIPTQAILFIIFVLLLFHGLN